jgi:hypothetical protein
MTGGVERHFGLQLELQWQQTIYRHLIKDTCLELVGVRLTCPDIKALLWDFNMWDFKWCKEQQHIEFTFAIQMYSVQSLACRSQHLQRCPTQNVHVCQQTKEYFQTRYLVVSFTITQTSKSSHWSLSSSSRDLGVPWSSCQQTIATILLVNKIYKGFKQDYH